MGKLTELVEQTLIEGNLVFAEDFIDTFPKLYDYLKKNNWKINSQLSFQMELDDGKHYHNWTIDYNERKGKLRLKYLHSALPFSQQSGYNGEEYFNNENDIITFLKKKEEKMWKDKKNVSKGKDIK
jgi:hypothetical protein